MAHSPPTDKPPQVKDDSSAGHPRQHIQHYNHQQQLQTLTAGKENSRKQERKTECRWTGQSEKEKITDDAWRHQTSEQTRTNQRLAIGAAKTILTTTPQMSNGHDDCE
jgi:hypothetical protein